MLLVENHENPKGNKTEQCKLRIESKVENHENPKGNKTLSVVIIHRKEVENHENPKGNKTSNHSTNGYTVAPRRELPLTGHQTSGDLQESFC